MAKSEPQGLKSEDLGALLTVEEAAGRLKLAPKTVRKLCRSRSLTAVNVQRRWRIPVSAIEEFLRDRTTVRV
jgi:excisionase family DNA binding protein